jgi:hypothetical protein
MILETVPVPLDVLGKSRIDGIVEDVAASTG